MRIPVVLALGAMVVVTACERRSAAPASSGDSTAVVDSTVADSSVGDSTVGSKVQSRPVRDSIIGRDSAFGPIGSIDSTGKLVPLRPKRP